MSRYSPALHRNRVDNVKVNTIAQAYLNQEEVPFLMRIATCATPNQFLQHPDETLTIYVRNR
jgi:hypothetical protein